MTPGTVLSQLYFQAVIKLLEGPQLNLPCFCNSVENTSNLTHYLGKKLVAGPSTCIQHKYIRLVSEYFIFLEILVLFLFLV